MKRKLFLISIIVITALCGVSWARTIEVPVSQVAVIAPGERVHDLTLGPRICLKFELPQEIQGLEIGYADLSAGLSLPAVTDDSLALFECFGLSSDWNQGFEWNDFPTPGGSVDSLYYSSYTFRCGSDTLLSLDVTNLVQQWNSPENANNGLIIIPRKTDFNSYRYFRYRPDQLRAMFRLRLIVPGRDE